MKRSLSRLPVSRGRTSSTSRISSSTQPNTPQLTRSKSSLSLRRTPQSVQPSSAIRPKKKDIRPIQDKTWQATALDRTQRYFQQCSEARPLLNKGVSIRPITLKMFVELMNVILRKIDSSFQELTLPNYTELLPIHLNTLMYPGYVTASTLKTANTMHSWPHILAILAWCVELHELSMMCDVEAIVLNVPSNAPFEIQVQKAELKMKFEFFQQFNQGKELDENQEKIIIESMYRKLCNFSDDDSEHSSKKLKKLQEELENWENVLINVEQITSALEDECNAAANKLKHLDESIEQGKRLKIDIVAEDAKFKRDIETIKATINHTESSIKKLRDNVTNQPMNLLQRTKELEQIDDLERQIELLKEEKKHQLDLRDEKDLELSKAKRQIEEIVLNYNIELMRPSLQYPELSALVLRQNNLLQPDMKEFINTNIERKQKLLKDLELKIREAQDTLATLKLTKENKYQSISTVKQEIVDGNNKLERLKSQHEMLIKNHEQVEKENEDLIKELKEKLLKLKECNPATKEKIEELKVLKTNCDELENKLLSKHKETETFFVQLEEEIRTKQIPRYDKIKKGIVDKMDKAVSQYFVLKQK